MKNILDLLNEENENIQNFISEDCYIPIGTHLEIYCNPNGLDSEEDSDGFSLFLITDKLISYFSIINNSELLEGCSIKENEVRIDIITEHDSFNRLEEYSFTPISSYFTEEDFLKEYSATISWQVGANTTVIASNEIDATKEINSMNLSKLNSEYITDSFVIDELNANN